MYKRQGRNLVECRKVEVEHHALAADFVDFALDRSEFFHRFGDVGIVLFLDLDVYKRQVPECARMI